MARSSRPPSSSPPSISSSAGVSPKNSRCNGQERALIDSCRPERAPLTARCATCSPAGIRLCPLTMFNSPRSPSQPELPHGFWCSRGQSLAAPHQPCDSPKGCRRNTTACAVLSHNVVPIPRGSFMTRRISQSISLTPELNRFVQAQVTSGRYQTASEVIRDGLRLLQERTRPVTGFTIPVGDHDA